MFLLLDLFCMKVYGSKYPFLPILYMETNDPVVLNTNKQRKRRVCNPECSSPSLSLQEVWMYLF